MYNRKDYHSGIYNKETYILDKDKLYLNIY